MYDNYEKIVVPSDHPTVIILYAFLFVAAIIVFKLFASNMSINKQRNEK